MKTLLFPFFAVLLLISASLIGCKSESTTQPPVATVDFTMTYQFVGDTINFYCQPTQTIYIDKVRYQYPAEGFDQTYNLNPNLIYYPSQVYYTGLYWVYIVRPADLSFTFTGRWVKDNTGYEIKKDVHIQ